ncbi:benzoate/H(+) symporter BenE family transporter [Streptosporangium sp. NBC_01755]|uniref:benzoate/H(+) symporter BenE family transporter n=1 Tax=unclassified Streptosporangium TaxID=2632669 RepID=UPI002DDAD8D0|nr:MULTISPECIES: benzoate/H(+) symporter BenE family transporter [unclassified Streptosporangium]WSA24971.1 benzoate/H(+) symporter BenE family transporter [Streptosporangium sp. NBC_01810]WSD03697.1 benzoate/H(+) symporter BenE family transporter [Streptosporangium sp. NBC_01755]
MTRLLQPVLAGMVTAVVGFAGSFAVVLAGLGAVGADQRQAASGLLALCVVSGMVAIWLGVRQRVPIVIAWSTPGVALLVATGPVEGGFPVAVGAFAVSGLLLTAAGLFPTLGRWIASIPTPIAGAMLAGVLLDLCVAPVRALAEVPLMAGPAVLAWALLSRFARGWAIPVALLVAVAAIALTGPGPGAVDVRPVVEVTTPSWSAQALVGIALPLFLVTMASQNVPGMAVLAGYGYHPPLRGILVSTGLASTLGAPLGGHAVNLAAISAALAAGPDADPDPARRWIASVSAGASMIVLGIASGPAAALVLLSPSSLIEAVAGLALLGAFVSAIASAVADPEGRQAAAVTFVVTASGLTLLGVGAAFWGLVAGGLMTVLHRRRKSPETPPDTTMANGDGPDAPQPERPVGRPG